MHSRFTLILLTLALITAACTSTRVLENKELKKSAANPDSLISRIPDFTGSLHSIEGRGKAIVSEPGNTERVTINFSGNRSKSLVLVKNSLGIEVAEILSEGDSLLIYNKIDKIVRKISMMEERLSSVSHLASINILEMINFTVEREQVNSVFETESNYYVLMLQNGAEVYIDKKTFTVLQVDQPPRSGLPYSRILYEAYGEIEGFILPRRITIFSSDTTTKVAMLIQSLNINPAKLNLEVDLPDDITYVTQ